MWELAFKVLVQGECDRCRPLMLESYLQESIWCGEVAICATSVRCVLWGVCARYVWSVFLSCSVCMAGHGFNVCKGPVSFMDRRLVDGAPCMTNRCVEMCMRFVCSGHCYSHHKIGGPDSLRLGGLAHCVLSQKGDRGQLSGKWVFAPQ